MGMLNYKYENLEVEMSMECAWAEMSICQNVNWLKCPWLEMSMGRKVRGRNVNGSKCPKLTRLIIILFLKSEGININNVIK